MHNYVPLNNKHSMPLIKSFGNWNGWIIQTLTFLRGIPQHNTQFIFLRHPIPAINHLYNQGQKSLDCLFFFPPPFIRLQYRTFKYRIHTVLLILSTESSTESISQSSKDLKVFWWLWNGFIIPNPCLRLEFLLPIPCLNVVLSSRVRISMVWINIENGEPG